MKRPIDIRRVAGPAGPRRHPAAGPAGAPGPALFGIDTMVFVYHFEGNERFGPAAGRLLAAAEAGRCRLVASVLTLYEVLVVPKRRRLDDLARRYRDLFASFPNLAVLPVEPGVVEVASDLAAEHELRAPDAIHLATAVQAGAAGFFSEDRRLRRVREVEVLSLDELDRHGIG